MKVISLILAIIFLLGNVVFAANTVDGKIYRIDSKGLVTEKQILVASIVVVASADGWEVVFRDKDDNQNTFHAKPNLSTQRIAVWTPAREVRFDGISVDTINVSIEEVFVYESNPGFLR